MENEILIVASKVKAIYKELGLNTSKEAIEELSVKVRTLITSSVEAAKADKRKTVKARDFSAE